MKKLIIMLTLGLFLTSNVFANVSCRTDITGTTSCTDGTTARTDITGTTTITSPNGQTTHCRTDITGTTTCY